MTPQEIYKQRIEEAAIKVSGVCEPCDYGDPFCASCHRPYMYDAAKKMGEVILNNQWVSVEEDLPPYEEDVVVYFINSDYNLNGNMFCHRTRRDDVSTDKNGFCIYNNEIITHWMSIPNLEGGE